MPTPPALHVVAAVIADGDRVLACRRAPGRDAAGRWEFPGGKVEPGEAPEAALAREILEELGVPVQVRELLDRTVTHGGARSIDLACYWAELTGPAPERSTDHDALRWVERERLHELDWADADLAAVGALADGRIQRERA